MKVGEYYIDDDYYPDILILKVLEKAVKTLDDESFLCFRCSVVFSTHPARLRDQILTRYPTDASLELAYHISIDGINIYLRA